MVWNAGGPEWIDVPQWIQPVGAMTVGGGQCAEAGHIHTIIPYRCGVVPCIQEHVVGLELGVDSAAIIIAAIQDYARRTGQADALTAAVDQALAHMRDNLPEAKS